MQKYFETPKNDMKVKAENAWFEICRENCIPYITLKNRTKFADVHWDYITYSTEVENILNAGNGRIRDGAIEIFKRHANTKSKYEANDLTAWLKNLEIPKAKLAAEELYDFIAAYVESNNTHHA